MFWQKNTTKSEEAGTKAVPAVPAKETSKSTGFLGRRLPPSLLSSEINILGNIVSEGDIDISANISGNVRGANVIIRKNGSVQGDVIANQVRIYGTVNGIVRAIEVELFEGAVVKGTIIHEKLAIEDGSSISGKLQKQEKVDLDASYEEEHMEIFKRFKLVD